MISFTLPHYSTLIAAITLTLLSACGGGGGSTGGEGGFTTSNTNTKPQISSESSASSAKSLSSLSTTSNSSKSSSSIKPPSGGDIIAPTTPGKFSVVSTFPDVVFLSWERSSDNIAVVAYKVFRDGIQIAETEELENYYADYTVAASKNYEYGVSAGDSVGNWSNVVTLKTATPQGSQISSSSSSTSSSASSTPTSIASSASANSVSSKASSTSSSKASSSASSKAVTMGVSFEWQRPLFRENGTDIYEHEIARYEIRYKLPNETNFTTVLVMSPLVSKTLADIPNNAYFEIATVDTNGAYSRFIPLHPL